MTDINELMERLDALSKKLAPVLERGNKQETPPAPVQGNESRVPTPFGSLPQGIFADTVLQDKPILPSRHPDELKNAAEMNTKIAAWRNQREGDTPTREEKVEQISNAVRQAIGMAQSPHPLSPEYQVARNDIEVGGFNSDDKKIADIVSRQQG